MNKEKRLIKFIFSSEGDTPEEVREYLKGAGIEPEELIKKSLAYLRQKKVHKDDIVKDSDKQIKTQKMSSTKT